MRHLKLLQGYDIILLFPTKLFTSDQQNSCLVKVSMVGLTEERHAHVADTQTLLFTDDEHQNDDKQLFLAIKLQQICSRNVRASTISMVPKFFSF